MEITWLDITDPPEVWAELGFVVDDNGVCVINGVEHRLIGPDPTRKGIVGWGVSGIDDDVTDVDGIPTAPTSRRPNPEASPDHPNGVFRIDHLVVSTSDTSRTAAAIEANGISRRGGRDTNHAGDAVDMTFFWAGDTLLELAGPPEPAAEAKPARLAGLAFASHDLDATARFLGDRLTTPVDAVQPGRRIAALTKAAGSTARIAVMTPHVKS